MTSDKEQEFIEQINQHNGILYKVAGMYCSNKADREDLVQDIYHQLWRSYPRYNPAFKFSTWMYRVALNVAISAYRRSKTSRMESLDEDLPDMANSESADRTQELLSVIEKLPPLDRALVLLQLEGSSYEEIAEVTGISASNVGTRLNRVKTKLKSLLETQGKL